MRMETVFYLLAFLLARVSWGLGYAESSVQSGQRAASRHRNWCAYVVTRTVSCVMEDGVETYIKPDYQRCTWGQCPRVAYRTYRRPRYKVAYKMVTEMEWKCCHGYSGEDCHDGPKVTTDTQVNGGRPRVTQTGYNTGGGQRGEGDSERIRQLEDTISSLTKDLHNMQTTIHSMNQRLPGLNGAVVPADSAQPQMKETINNIQTKLDHLYNRTQVHDQTLLNINNHLVNGGGNELDGVVRGGIGGNQLNTLKEEILTELETRVTLSCSACQAGVEDLRRQQQEDRERIQALEKLVSSMDQHLRQSLDISRSETQRSQACCNTVTKLENRMSDLEVRVTSTANKCDTIKGRLDKELAGTGGGKGRVTEDRLNGRLRELEKKVNNTLRKTEQRCTNTGNNVKDSVQRDVTQLRNMVLSRLDDNSFKIGKIELDVSVLGDTVTDHSRRLSQMENITTYLDRRLTSIANICNETCGANGKVQKTDDTVKTLEWRVVANEEEIQKFNTKLDDLSVSGDSLIDRVISLTNDVKKIIAVTGENGENFNRIVTEVETLGRDFEDCSICSSVEEDLRLLTNSTMSGLSKCQTELTDLRRKVNSEESVCSQVCSNLQEEVGRLREDVEECTGQCKVNINDLKKRLDSHGVHSGRLGGDLKSIQGELAGVMVTFNSINDTLKGLGRHLSECYLAQKTVGESRPRMELSSDSAVAALDMSQVKSKDDEPFGVDGDYESLPPHVSVATHMTAGAVAGILEHTVMYPVDSVKTRMQSLQPDPNAQYRSVYQALKRIIQTEGVFRPLRGLNITMMGAGPAHALYFACYERVKRSLSDVIQSGGNSHLANGIAGSVATVLHDAVMNPAEVIKQRMQMYNSPYRGLWDCLQTVRRTEGVRAFYRSYSTQLTMNIPFQAVHFITYELMQEQLNPQRHYHPGTHIVSGAAAGAVSAAITTPLDVCKTLLNTQENVALNSMNISGHLSGMANAFRTVYRLGGLAAFFKGAQARVIYQMPSTAIAWSVYEFFKYFLTKQQPKQAARPGPM